MSIKYILDDKIHHKTRMASKDEKIMKKKSGKTHSRCCTHERGAYWAWNNGILWLGLDEWFTQWGPVPYGVVVVWRQPKTCMDKQTLQQYLNTEDADVVWDHETSMSSPLRRARRQSIRARVTSFGNKRVSRHLITNLKRRSHHLIKSDMIWAGVTGPLERQEIGLTSAEEQLLQTAIQLPNVKAKQRLWGLHHSLLSIQDMEVQMSCIELWIQSILLMIKELLPNESRSVTIFQFFSVRKNKVKINKKNLVLYQTIRWWDLPRNEFQLQPEAAWWTYRMSSLWYLIAIILHQNHYMPARRHEWDQFTSG